MTSTEQTRQSVHVERLRREVVENIRRSVEVSITGYEEISKLISDNRQQLSRGEIAPVVFHANERIDLHFVSQWLVTSKQVLQMTDVFAELTDERRTVELRGMVTEFENELQVREESQRSIDAFISKHPIPESWNEELVKRNMAAMERGEGIDARDFIASLPR